MNGRPPCVEDEFSGLHFRAGQLVGHVAMFVSTLAGVAGDLAISEKKN
jgi:hypothetical protein